MSEAPLAYGLSGVAVAAYLLIAVALRQRSRRWRQILWLACSAELAGVLGVGSATLMRPGAFADQTVWSHYGEGYGYLPLALPMLTLALLAHDRRLARSDVDGKRLWSCLPPTRRPATLRGLLWPYPRNRGER